MCVFMYAHLWTYNKKYWPLVLSLFPKGISFKETTVDHFKWLKNNFTLYFLVLKSALVENVFLRHNKTSEALSPLSPSRSSVHAIGSTALKISLVYQPETERGFSFLVSFLKFSGGKAHTELKCRINWKIGIGICTTTMFKIAGRNLLYSIGSLAQCSVMT